MACGHRGVDNRILRFTPASFTEEALLAAVRGSGVQCPHGATYYMTTVVDSRYRLEMRVGTFPVLASDRLPSPLAVGYLVVGPMVTEAGQEHVVAVAVGALKAAHAAMGATNPFAIQSVTLRDFSKRGNTCACGAPTFNGPHVDPAIRALCWDREQGRPVVPPPGTKPAKPSRRRHR